MTPGGSVPAPREAQITGAAPIWLGEQECYSWALTAWSAAAGALIVGWIVRVATRNQAARSA